MSPEGLGLLRAADAIIFDCDGVLVDVSESYYAAIRETAARALGGRVRAPPVSRWMIDGFKASGGFNDEVDLAYAVSLAMAAAARAGLEPEGLVRDAAARAGADGLPSVKSYLAGAAGADAAAAAGRLLGPHPGTGGGASPFRLLFNRLFYGAEMFARIHAGADAPDGPEEGLIERDRPILDGPLLERLRAAAPGRMALVTGRGLESARRTLGVLLDGFDLSCSFFLEDEDRSMAKPAPEALERAMAGLRSRRCLYVGDSAEDMIMAGRASSGGGPRAAFCGITGTSADPGKKLEAFERGGAAAVLDGVGLLPNALNLAGRGADSAWAR